jgi:glucuronokinase
MPHNFITGDNAVVFTNSRDLLGSRSSCNRSFPRFTPPHHASMGEEVAALHAKREHQVSSRVGVVLLAAGYGTRLARDMRASPAFVHLAETPKPLLPVGGRVLLDHWIEALEAVPTLQSVVVVTNGAHHQRYVDWLASRGAEEGFNAISIVSDGSTSNETRLGAVADIQIGLDSLTSAKGSEGKGVTPPDVAVIIAGDTLLPGVDMAERLAEFEATDTEIGVFAYNLQDIKDCVRRGMLEIADGSSRITRLVEKPAVEDCPSSLATAPVYILRRDTWHTVPDFLAQSTGAGVRLENRDAPGFWLGWTIPRKHCVVLTTDKRVDIGGLAHYREALVDYAKDPAMPKRIAIEPAVGRALPRVGLLGNPSDGYGGKCIAVAIESEGYAEVVATPTTGPFEVFANEVHEMPGQFPSVLACSDFISDCGIHFGAKQLVMAGVHVFTSAHAELQNRKAGSGKRDDLQDVTGMSALSHNCRLSYSTTIPVRIGLSGSSALILATVRALARFYQTSLYELDPAEASWPKRILAGETSLLGIAAGLQDRVAQVYQGCMYMDLADPENPKLERLDVGRLPALWLAYSKGQKAGEHSGKVHSTLKKRFAAGDEDVLGSMKALASVAYEGRAALLPKGDVSVLPELARRNWELRLDLVGGPSGIAEENVRLVKCAHTAGFAGKLTGSGGAVLCVPDPLRPLSDEDIDDAKRIFDDAGFVFRKLRYSAPSNECKV